MRLEVFVNLSCQSSTIILPLCIKYSMRDLLSDVNFFHEPYSCDIDHTLQMI